MEREPIKMDLGLDNLSNTGEVQLPWKYGTVIVWVWPLSG